MTTEKHPWFKFYPQDWRGSARLRLCSRAARSLFLDLLGLMHESEHYGHLELNGKPMDRKLVARMLGDSSRSFDTLLRELLDAEVLRTNDAGIIYCDRMVRDAATRERRAAGGVRSLDNPNVPRPKETTKDTIEGIHQGRPQIPDTRSQIPEEPTTCRAGSATSREEPSRPPRQAPSWLEPIAEVWRARVGVFHYGKAGKHLKPLHDAGQSSEEMATRLGRYLDKTEPKFVSIARFAETYAEHGPFRFKSPPVVDGVMSDELHALLYGHTRSYVLS